MRIKAGEQVIEISDLRVSGDYAIVNLETMLTAEQMTALKTQPWQVYTESQDIEGQEIETLVNSYTGYNEQLELALTLKRGVSLQEEIQAKQATLDEIAPRLPDELAAEYVSIYPEYKVGVFYEANYRFRDEGILYKVVQAHTTQADWKPATTPSLYTRVGAPDESPQPWVSGTSYDLGVLVTHNNKTWESMVPNNVWEPGAPGVYDNIWREVV